MFLRLDVSSDSRVLVGLVAFLALLPPTFLMGLSLPCLSRAVVGDIGKAARDIGLLYGADVVGASLGAFAGTWYLIGTFGIDGTIAIAALLSLAAGKAATGEPGLVLRWSGYFFASGFLAIGLEVLWFRFFGVVYESMAYTFGHVLGVFLAADAAGLLVGALLAHRLRQPARAFHLTQAASGLYALAALLALYFALELETVRLLFADWPSKDAAAAEHAFFFFVLPLIIVAPSAFLIGLSFPLVQQAVQREPAAVAERVGLLQLANIAGNALGGAVSGLLLLHWLGFTGALTALALIALGFLGLWAWQGADGQPRWRVALLALAGGSALVLALPGAAAFWASVMGLPRAVAAGSVMAEDATAMVAMQRRPERAEIHIGGYLNGWVPFMAVHVELGALGPLLHPAPNEVLIVGFGSGGTPFTAGLNPATQRIDVVEIAAPVYRAHREATGRGFGLPTGVMFDDPRYRLLLDDGRRYLASSGKRYDVIESDPLLPRSARSGMLNSAEYFRLLLRHLKPGGLAVHWRSSERVDHTFRHVFPHGLVIGHALVGSNRPIEFVPERIERLLAEPAVVAYLGRVGIEPGMIGEQLLHEHRGAWTPATAPSPDARLFNSDLQPRDEFFLNNPDLRF